MAYTVEEGIARESQRVYSIVKPEGFEIPPESVRIHGITQAMAEEEGERLDNLFDRLMPLFVQCDEVVAYNVAFDKRVILSELYRMCYWGELSVLQHKKWTCAMMLAQAHFSL